MSTQPTERPFLATEDEVRAILDGTQTEFWREVHWRSCRSDEEDGNCLLGEGGGEWWPYYCYDGNEIPLSCPFGEPGTILYVKETWGYWGSSAGYSKDQRTREFVSEVKYHADGDGGKRHSVHFDSFDEMMAKTPQQNIKHPAGFEELTQDEQNWIHDDLLTKWWKSKKRIPSVHMPRWASRIDLRRLNPVRVEQQDGKWWWVFEAEPQE